MIAAARIVLDVLFASLWQGALIAGCGAAMLAFSGRRFNAATRHIVLEIALAATVLIAVLTTFGNLTAHVFDRGEHALLPHASASAVPVNASSQEASAASRWDRAARRVEIALSDSVVMLLAGAWSVCAWTLVLRIGFCYLRLSRLVQRSTRIADRNGVRVYASSATRIPIAAGFLNPAIVVPHAVVAAGDEFECAILHELAHVRRGDAWSHACECIVHAFFFFNPAALWLLRAIALEREAACDDWAAHRSRDLDKYTLSLAALALQNARQDRQLVFYGAMGLGNALLQRVERLRDARRNASLSLSGWAIGGYSSAVAALALALLILAPAVAFAAATQVAIPPFIVEPLGMQEEVLPTSAQLADLRASLISSLGADSQVHSVRIGPRCDLESPSGCSAARTAAIRSDAPYIVQGYVTRHAAILWDVDFQIIDARTGRSSGLWATETLGDMDAVIHGMPQIAATVLRHINAIKGK
jgi:beta-lactamase regulating signal transducer with metallopeptidase domain